MVVRLSNPSIQEAQTGGRSQEFEASLDYKVKVSAVLKEKTFTNSSCNFAFFPLLFLALQNSTEVP